MKKLTQQQMRYLGIALIALGIFAALRLWWALPVLILGGVGSYLFMERRKEGRIAAAVQSGLWLLGMAVLFLFGFINIPAILLLAGASLLIRGREHEVEQRVTSILARFGVHLPPVAHMPQAAITPVHPVAPAAPEAPEAPAQTTPSTGETTRL